MSKILIICALFVSVSTVIFAQDVVVKSPDGAIEMRLTVAAALSYSVTMDGKTILADSKLQMEFADGTKLGNNLEIRSKKTSLFDQTWTPVYGRKSQITNRYNEAIVQIAEKDGKQRIFSLECRAYNDGAAFRYAFGKEFGDKLAIKEEINEFSFEADDTCWPSFLNSYTTEHQALFPQDKLSGISPEDIIGLPLTIQISDKSYCSITEAALVDWAGMYLTKQGRSDLLVESGELTGGSQPFAFRKELPKDTKKVRLVIDASGSNSSDHADIVDLKLIKENGDTTWLSDINPATSRQEWGDLKKDKSVDGNPLTIAGNRYEKGLGTHANAIITYKLPEGYNAIEGKVGIDSEVNQKGKIKFRLYAVQSENQDNVLKSTLSRRAEGDIAVETQTPHVSPWRVIMLGRSPSDLVNSDIVLNLNEPSKISDTSWIKPGVSSWNWLSYGGKMDMDLLKGFIDLSSSMNWPYALIDDGWYKDSNCTTSIDKLDIPALASYAASKNVKLWLWVHWQVLDARLEETLALYQKWGIAGVKIDFMSRDDQWMVNWYHKVLQSAASHKLMIDFHGSYKPTGDCRTWPNFMTCEAVYGNEQNGDRQNDPVHKTTLPFTRMLAGPMDYTPGSLSNETKNSWVSAQPIKTLGTRCQELAICMIYDSPFLAMADKPENYYSQKGAEYLKNLPTAWDDTKVLDGQIGQYISMVRKKNDVWYVAAITNWDSRTLNLPLTFLDSGSYSIVLYEDGPEAGTTNARDVVKREMTVTAKDTLSMKMASGGGFVAILKKTK
jgi:hypothetical protein